MSSLVEFGEKHVAAGLGRLVKGAIFESGEGSYVRLSDGRKLLDFSCGIAVVNLGHCHPKVTAAAVKQCQSLVHGQCSLAFHRPYLELIERLLPIMPHPTLDTFYFWNSGAEAVEAAVKLARTATGKQNIIAMQGGYHGRTYGTMALTRSKTVYSQGVAPLMPGVYTIPFPYWHQLGVPQTTPEDELVRLALYQLDILLLQQTTASDTAAIILEPVIGEGGYVPAPVKFLQGLRSKCDENGILLIVDEVQTGFGRTGKYFACEYAQVRPDIMVMAKGLANGFPLSGIVSRKELMDKQKPGTMGGTYAGNAVSCAAAIAVAEALQEEKILENVRARSAQLFAGLRALQSQPFETHFITDVRGLGLMVGIEFAAPSSSPHDPASSPRAPKGMASKISAKCVDKGMLLLSTSIYEVIRFMPPLNVSEEDMDKALQIFKEVVTEVARG